MHDAGVTATDPEIRLVPLTDLHAGVLRGAMTDPAIQRFTRVPVPLPEGWVQQWLTRFVTDDRFGWAVLDDADEVVGYAVTGPVDREGREVEVGYAVLPQARGRGVATATLRELSAWALAEGMQRVVALVSVDNPASSRVAAKAGFLREGVLRSKHHRGDERVDLESWSLLPDDDPDLG